MKPRENLLAREKHLGIGGSAMDDCATGLSNALSKDSRSSRGLSPFLASLCPHMFASLSFTYSGFFFTVGNSAPGTFRLTSSHLGLRLFFSQLKTFGKNSDCPSLCYASISDVHVGVLGV